MAKINFDISKRLDITVRRGDSFKLELTLKDSSDNALNLYGDKFNLVVTANPGIRMASEGDNSSTIAGIGPGTIKVSPNITDTESTTAATATGKVSFEATATEMKGFIQGVYTYDIQRIDSDSNNNVDSENNTQTILYGNFIVKRDGSTISE